MWNSGTQSIHTKKIINIPDGIPVQFSDAVMHVLQLRANLHQVSTVENILPNESDWDMLKFTKQTGGQLEMV